MMRMWSNSSARALAISATVFLTLPGCFDALDDGAPETGSLSQESGFNWGSDCSAGSGQFDQAIAHNQITAIGVIPVNKRNIRIDLTSPSDVDVQLIDEQTGHQIIAWPSGDLSGAGEACTTYHGVEYCYSGYNGVNGQLGNEWIQVNGVTNRKLIMKAFGYQAGDAVVEYAWNAANTCKEVGSGSFEQQIPYQAVTEIGEIPVNKVNVKIDLTSTKDIDIQLYDGDTAIVQWPNGLLNGPYAQSIEYQGMTIRWTGYNGDGTGLGNESIEIDGRLTRTLTMKAFGYAAGFAQVDYQWGIGAGDACGSQLTEPCKKGLTCKNGDDGNIAVDIPGECHTEHWCESNASAAADCAGLLHPAVPGMWGCNQFSCQWQMQVGGLEGQMCGGIAGFQCAPGLECKGMDPNVADAAGTCRAADYCEVITVDQDCANLVHTEEVGSWGCDQSVCTWVPKWTVDPVSFDDLKANPVAHIGPQIIQVTWSVDAATGGVATEVFGDAPTIAPPLGPGGDFVILNGLTCNGNDCDVDRGNWVTAWGRIGLLQGGHLLMNVLRVDPGTTCSQADTSCPSDMHCQIGIGCPSENCGINPPGMCLED